MTDHEFSHGSTSVQGPKGDKDSCPSFPGESYSITQYNAWLREFRGYCARKRCLTVATTGRAEIITEADEATQQARNRESNTELYGLLMRSMARNASDLAAEIEERYLDVEHGFADGFEALQFLKARVRIDNYHRNDVIEKRIANIILKKLPSGCTRDQFRTKAKELRELNSELLEGKRTGASLSAAYFQLIPVTIRESKHALETKLRDTRIDPNDADSTTIIENPSRTLEMIEDLIERVYLDEQAAAEHAATCPRPEIISSGL